MSVTPQPKRSMATRDEPTGIASTDSACGTAGLIPPTRMDPTADNALSGLSVLQLDVYAQTLRALGPPTAVDPSAADEVSVLTAARFRAHAEMFQEINARFAAAHDELLRSLAQKENSNTVADPGDAVSAT